MLGGRKQILQLLAMLFSPSSSYFLALVPNIVIFPTPFVLRHLHCHLGAGLLPQRARFDSSPVHRDVCWRNWQWSGFSL